VTQIESVPGNLNDLFMLDPSNLDSLVWVDLTGSTTGTLPSARSYHSMTSIGRLLFVFGGWVGFNGVGTNNLLEETDVIESDPKTSRLRFTLWQET